MGIFSKKNKYDITPDVKNIKSVVTKLNENVVKINAKITIPDGYAFIVGKNGKALDFFESGEHFFAYSNLPYICRKYNIDKIIDGEQQTSINANLYLIDKNLRGADFKTYRKVQMGTKAYGIFRANVFGVYSYRVVNVKEFMQSLLNQFDYIKTGEAEDIISSWVDELIVDELEKQNFIIDDIVANNPKISEVLKLRLEKFFKIIGLEIIELKIIKYKLPKKYQSASDKNIQKIYEDNKKIVDNKTDDADANITEDNLQSSTLNNQNDYVPFGSFKFEEYKENEINNNSSKKKFVDLNLDKEYDKNPQKTKRCLNCGTENDLNANHCVICGEIFNNDDI